eukprot:TRINITY_DN2752_c0_g1_i1.p1 TRINITY_DN2752_c0_g1~~TRINITY_DN2752_c0_g1_i1.p1  ORF type:complete len:247 (-),score=45.88 TRINITY_DN2752_c0_g1_i1:48-788(-)
MVRNIVKHEGIFKLWRGNTATLVRVFPYAAVQFMSYEQFKKLLVPNDGKPNVVWFLMAGALAGCSAVACTYPLDLVRARMAAQVKNEQYANLIDALVKIYKHEGPKALFRGVNSTIQGIIPYAGVNFGTYEALKYYAPVDEETGRISTVTNLFCGGIAGATGQTVSYPWDVVRRRQQTWGFAEGTKAMSKDGTMKTMITILKQEGISALFKGISINYIKVSPGVAITFTTYEFIQVHLFGKHYVEN